MEKFCKWLLEYMKTAISLGIIVTLGWCVAYAFVHVPEYLLDNYGIPQDLTTGTGIVLLISLAITSLSWDD